jgi:phosphoribosylglycinamide formyltransferase 1
MSNPKIIVFASGSKDGGGSGFEKLVEAVKSGVLDAEIAAVVSNHAEGGVLERADRLGISFIHFPKPWDAKSYQRIVAKSGAEWVALSGWLKLVKGLDPAKTFNIHPALLSLLNGRFGGAGMYGHYVHEAVKESLDTGEITESGVTMHFVTDEYDRGPVFFEKKILLSPGMSSDAIGKLVNNVEHTWQPKITNMVVNGQISWDGKNPETLKVPDGYEFLPVRLRLPERHR